MTTLDRLKELYEKTTQGEWKADTRDPADCVVYVGEDGFVGNIGSVITPVLSEEQITDERVRVLFDTDISNAEFIAAIHNDFPRIVKEFETLEKTLDAYEDEHTSTVNDLMEQVGNAERENAALQREAEFWFNTYRDLQLIRYGDDFVKQHMAELEAALKQEER